MRRTVWIVVVGLLALAVVGQSVTLVERRSRDEFTGDRFDDGETVRIRTWPPRIVMNAPDLKRTPRDARFNIKPGPDERDEVIWSGSVESSPKVHNEAYNDALDRARNLLVSELGLVHAPTREFVNKYLKSDYSERQGPTDDIIGTTYIVKMDLQLTRELWRELAKSERGARVQERMIGLVKLTAIATVLLGCVAIYIRFDEWTKGYYTGRLRVAMVLLAGVATATIAHLRI